MAMRGAEENREVSPDPNWDLPAERICSRFEKQLQLLRISFHWSRLQLYKEPSTGNCKSSRLPFSFEDEINSQSLEDARYTSKISKSESCWA